MKNMEIMQATVDDAEEILKLQKLAGVFFHQEVAN
jgi:hypothetical protein